MELYLDERGLEHLVSAAKTPGGGGGLEVDVSLDEVAALLTCADTYATFSESLRKEGGAGGGAPGPFAVEFGKRLQTVVMNYVALEEDYLGWSIAKVAAPSASLADLVIST